MSKERKNTRRMGRRKVDPFLVDKELEIDYKRPDILCRFISERGKIIPSRISGVTAKNQRKLALAIKRARQIALVPYSRLENF